MSIPSFLNIASRGYSDYLNKPIPDPTVDPNDIQSREALLAAQKALHDQILAQVGQAPIQMPSVQPNKGLAIGGGILALIGALTGDKYAQGGFQQFMGGLNQAAQSEQQRLLQQEMLKRQQKERDDALILKALGMDVETAADQYRQDMLLAQSKAEADARARREAQEYQRDVQKLGIQQKGLNQRAQLGYDAKMAAINQSSKARKMYDELIALGLTPQESMDRAFEMSKYTADVAGKQASTELTKARTLKTQVDTELAPKKLAIQEKLAVLRERDNMFMQSYRNRMASNAELNTSLRIMESGRMEPANPKDDREALLLANEIARIETELKGHEAWMKKNEELATGMPNDGSPAANKIKQELVRITARMEYLTSKLAETRDKYFNRVQKVLSGEASPQKSGYSPIVPQIGTSDPSMSGAIRPIR